MLKLSSSSAFGRMASLRTFSTGTKANQAQRILGRYSDQFPYELARVQTGINVQLREFEEQKRLQSFSYDLQFQKDGKVHPILDDEFIGPNGCSLRPPTSTVFQEVARNFEDDNATIFVIPEGTPLPATLTLLHEHSDHFSLQCTQPMELSELNEELTKFLNKYSQIMDQLEFDQKYPFSPLGWAQ